MKKIKQVTVLAKEAKMFFKANFHLSLSLAEMYCAVWREPPWNEYFWKVNEVKDELIAQNCKKTAIACYAIYQNGSTEKIFGFTLGYQVNKKEMKLISLSEELNSFLSGYKLIFYIDELAVEAEFRDRGIALNLCRNLIEKAESTGIELFILRTDKRAIPARRVYKKLGFKETGIRDGKHLDRTYLIKKTEN